MVLPENVFLFCFHLFDFQIFSGDCSSSPRKNESTSEKRRRILHIDKSDKGRKKAEKVSGWMEEDILCANGSCPLHLRIVQSRRLTRNTRTSREHPRRKLHLTALEISSLFSISVDQYSSSGAP